MNTDELELKAEVYDAKVDEYLQIISNKRHIPFEILKNTYDYCVRYPEIKDIARDDKLRKIWTQKYDRNHEIKGNVEIINQEEKK
jgi:hypothetical protein